MIVINIWGAPSSGKSTTAAGLFFLMKINKFKVELVHEFAKELVLDRRENIFSNQNYIFAEQARRIDRIADNNYDFAITDSPLPLPVFYDDGKYNKSFENFVFDEFHKNINMNYLMERKHTFEVIGRRHNEQQSIILDTKLRDFLTKRDIKFTNIEASPKSPEIILNDIIKRLPTRLGMPFSNLDDKNLK